MDQPDPFDPERLRLRPGAVLSGGQRASPKKRKAERFVKFPWSWVERLVEARYVATYRVALHVLHQHWRSGGKPFALSNRTVKTEGVGRIAKWRALGELEQLGLITIERHKGRSPRITVIT